MSSDKADQLDYFRELLNMMDAFFHEETGCAWSLAQTYSSLIPYTLEETYEVADAVYRKDHQDLKNELGDLLFQIVFFTSIASRLGHFDFNDVAQAIVEKNKRRHPHLKEGYSSLTPEEVNAAWEAEKKIEREQQQEDNSILSTIPTTLPGIDGAYKLQQKAATVGFDWPNHEPIFDKFEEELHELKAEINPNSNLEAMEDELGDLLFTCVNLARHLNIHPEVAIQKANRKFAKRFRHVERLSMDKNLEMEKMTLEELDKLWEVAKKESKP